METVIQDNVRQELVKIIENVEKVIVGKRPVIELVLTALLAGGHVLVEDVPGVGKTRLAAALAKSCGGTFNRLQMTPDVMPSDITGFSMIGGKNQEWEFKKGAAFCNFLLADEINRASAKSQSSLLEIMEENQVSQDGVTYALPQPFMVLATQNPVETYGTYHLPEAQMDRFLMKVSMGYPDRADEIAILGRKKAVTERDLEQVCDCDRMTQMKEAAEKVLCSDAILEYIMRIVETTRNYAGIGLGVSPRGGIAMVRAAKAYAYLKGRNYVIPDDIKYLAPYVFAHRLMLSGSARTEVADAGELIRKLVLEIEVPIE